MVKFVVPTFEVLVAGDPGSGKRNFINRFLLKFPSSAELRRKSGVTYFTQNSAKNINITLHDVYNLESTSRKSYDKMDVVFLFYNANDSQTFQSLEKWIGLPRSEIEKEELLKKEVYSVLVADLSNLGNQQDVAESLAQKAKKLQETFGISRFFSSSFEDEESASSAFQTILDEVITPKLKEKSPSSNVESTEKLLKSILTENFSTDFSQKCVGGTSNQDFLNSVDIDLNESEPEYLNFKKTAKILLDIMQDKTLSSDELIYELRNATFQNLLQ